MKTLEFAPTVWAAIHDYLDHATERMAFLAAVPEADGSSALAAPGRDAPKAYEHWSVVDVLYLDDATDYERQDWFGMELADDVRPRSLKWATGHEAALVEMHSHGEGPRRTTFSNHDLRGLLEGAPGLVWRLRGRPYGAVVVGGRHDFDGLVWDGPTMKPRSLDGIKVGPDTLRATGHALGRLSQLKDADEHSKQHKGGSRG